MIDLHLHTTASDGRCAPDELVRRAFAAGVTVLSVTDHDTMAATATVTAAAERCGIRSVPGIEITAVIHGKDVHILGYFLDSESSELADFLDRQRQDRVRRVHDMTARLRELGYPLDPHTIVERAGGAAGRSVGRPHVAQALVQARHVATVRQAFDTLIGEGGPAYVARRGAAPGEVVRLIARAGGVSSLAHPGLLRRDDLIPDLAGVGLSALEAYHADHSPETQTHYLNLAQRLRLAVSGGSDYHGESVSRPRPLGSVALPEPLFLGLRDRLRPLP